MSSIAAPSPALSVLSEEEQLFRDTVRDFAETEVKPHVMEMDEAGKFRPDLIAKFFELGLMGIEVPEEYGGAGGSIFMATLAIEELARVDASAAIYVDVHNTLFNNAILRWASDEQKARLFPRTLTDLLGAYALSEPASGSDAFALQCKAEKVGDDWELTGRKFWITNGAEAGIFIVFANTDFPRATRASPPSWSSAISPASRSAKRRTSSAFGPPAPRNSSSRAVRSLRPTCSVLSGSATRWRSKP